MVHELALELQENFSPYVEKLTTALSRHLETSHHEDMISYCLVAMPQLIRATAKSTQPDRHHVNQLTCYIMQQLLKVKDIYVTSQATGGTVRTQNHDLHTCYSFVRSYHARLPTPGH